MKRYGQFCPVAKASEILGERWTHLVIREFIAGSETFNDLRRGLPLISPSLLSARLKTLEEKGIVERERSDDGITYCLTEAGLELKPIIEAVGVWGHRWVRSELADEDLDPSLLMWDIHRTLHSEYFGTKRVVLLFEFTDYDAKNRRWWLVIENGDIDVCMRDPGHEIDFQLLTDVRTMTAIWMGDLALGEALRTKALRLTGTNRFKRDIATWLGSSFFADVEPAR